MWHHVPTFFSFFVPLRTNCLLTAVSLPLSDSSGGTFFFFFAARCKWCWCCALLSQKKPLWSLKTNQSAYQTSPSCLSGAVVHHHPSTLTLFLPPRTGRWYRAQSVLHADRSRHWPARCGTFKLIMPCYARFLLLLLCLILIVECRKHKSRKKRWSVQTENHKPGT